MEYQGELCFIEVTVEIKKSVLFTDNTEIFHIASRYATLCDVVGKLSVDAFNSRFEATVRR